MKWNQVLDKWSQGEPFTYPTRLKNKFQWNTSVLTEDGTSIYREKFKSNLELPLEQDWTSYQEYITHSSEKYVIPFYNPSQDTLLVIPTPRKGKNFATIKDFTDKASLLHQKKFWQEVSQLARREIGEHQKVWISAHGLGVPYFHIRISQTPKYYFDEGLAKG